MNTVVLEMTHPTDLADKTTAGLVALVAVLRQLASLIESATDAQYISKPEFINANNIGSHVRHCLDHVDTLLIALQSNNGTTWSYDERQRGTEIETNRNAALRAIERQEQTLQYLIEYVVDQPLSLRVLLTATGPSVTVNTSVGRELAFVLSHTIHHNALIGVIAKLVGVSVPERFGYAPSTLAHLGKRLCVQ